jgi:hypothetical protein
VRGARGSGGDSGPLLAAAATVGYCAATSVEDREREREVRVARGRGYPPPPWLGPWPGSGCAGAPPHQRAASAGAHPVHRRMGREGDGGAGKGGTGRAGVR